MHNLFNYCCKYFDSYLYINKSVYKYEVNHNPYYNVHNISKINDNILKNKVYSLYYVYDRYPKEISELYFKHLLSDNLFMSEKIYNSIYRDLFKYHRKYNNNNNYIDYYRQVSKFIFCPSPNNNIYYIKLYYKCCKFLGYDYMNYLNLLLLTTSLIIEGYYKLINNNSKIYKILNILSSLNLDCQLNIFNILNTTTIYKYNIKNLSSSYERLYDLLN